MDSYLEKFIKYEVHLTFKNIEDLEFFLSKYDATKNQNYNRESIRATIMDVIADGRCIKAYGGGICSSNITEKTVMYNRNKYEVDLI